MKKKYYYLEVRIIAWSIRSFSSFLFCAVRSSSFVLLTATGGRFLLVRPRSVVILLCGCMVSVCVSRSSIWLCVLVLLFLVLTGWSWQAGLLLSYWARVYGSVSTPRWRMTEIVVRNARSTPVQPSLGEGKREKYSPPITKKLYTHIKLYINLATFTKYNL